MSKCLVTATHVCGEKCSPSRRQSNDKKAEVLGVDPKVMKGAWEKNSEIRKDLDWHTIAGAVSGTKGEDS